MEKRVWTIISWPAAVLTLITGLYMAYVFNYWTQPWMIIKLVLLVGLYAYHFACGKMVADFKNDKNLVIPAKKGFRQVRKMKALDNRHIIVMDYMVSQKQFQELSQMLENKVEIDQQTNDEGVDDALELLRN